MKGTKKKEDLEVTGTADPRGTEPYNKDLSRRRAQAVVDYLKEQGVENAEFEVYARGENGMEEGMPKLWPEQRHAEVETK